MRKACPTYFILFIVLSGLVLGNAGQWDSVIKSKTAAYLAKTFGVEKTAIKIRFKHIPDLSKYDTVNTEIKISSTGHKVGYQTIWVEVYHKNEYANKYPMIVNADVTKTIVVAAAKITREQIITDGSVRLEPCEIKTGLASYYMNPADIIGLQSKHVIKPGTPILVSMVRKLPAIERGDHVTIKVIVDNLLISSKGIAKNDGQVGDKIRVRSDITGKEMIGLTGPNKEVYVVPQGVNHVSLP